MANQNPSRSFFVPFVVSVLLLLAAAAYAWRTTQQLHALQNQKPWTLANQRDKSYPFVVDAYGFKYQGESNNLIDEEALVFGAFEKERLFFLRDFLAACGVEKPVVIDVGANTGHHSLFLSRHAHKVHAFEPFPPVIRRFRDNLALNPHITNIELHEVGLGDKAGEFPFSQPPDDNHGTGSFRTDAVPAGRKEFEKKLKVVVGDEWLRPRESGNVAVVKIDVEGFEEFVLRGLGETLKKHRPLVMVELSPTSHGGTIDSLDKLKALFPDDYEFRLLESRNIEGAVKGVYRLHPLRAGDWQAGRQLEVVACPAERRALLP